MQSSAKLLTALAAFTGAIAWPATALIIVSLFRRELQSVLNKLPLMLDRLRKATISGVAVELDRLAVAETDVDQNKGGIITPAQVEAAARIEVQTRDAGREELNRELDKLCVEYDSLRRAMPRGDDRMQAMTRVVVKMRALAQSLVGSIDGYKSAPSPGGRLAAIIMMQMVPHVADLVWLGERFSTEKPFLFYHAALALENAVNISDTPEKRALLRDVAEKALAEVKRYTGRPDPNTTNILETLLSKFRPS